LEDDASNFDGEEMAMITWRSKKFFKKARERIPIRRILANPEAAIVSSSRVALNVENVTTL